MTETIALEASTARAEALAILTDVLDRGRFDDPRREAILVLCAAADLPPIDLIVSPEAPLGPAAPRVDEFLRRRARGEPLSRIVGKREFWGLEFRISPAVLDPRPETETVVEAALRLLGDRRDELLRILDLGTGSGALLCALLGEFPEARGVGVELSPAAARVAAANVEACGFAGRTEIRIGDWTKALEGPFDLIVSNPPYVASAELERLPREVLHFDPRLALDGGRDGLDAYRRIIPESPRLMSGGGWLAVEVGAGQAAQVAAIAEASGLAEIAVDRDLAGHDRVVAARVARA